MKITIKKIILSLTLVALTINSCPDHNDTLVCVKDQNNLKSLIYESQGPILISLYMDRCGWCNKMEPIIEKLSQEDKFAPITFYTANGPELQAPKLLQAHTSKQEVPGYPFIILMNHGKIIDKQIGGTTEKELEIKLNKLLKAYKKNVEK